MEEVKRFPGAQRFRSASFHFDVAYRSCLRWCFERDWCAKLATAAKNRSCLWGRGSLIQFSKFLGVSSVYVRISAVFWVGIQLVKEKQIKRIVSMCVLSMGYKSGYSYASLSAFPFWRSICNLAFLAFSTGGWLNPPFFWSLCSGCITQCLPSCLRTPASQPDCTSSWGWAPFRCCIN